MKKTVFLILVSLMCVDFLFSQKITRIDPPNWWIGMEWNTLTLLIYGENIQDLNPEINYDGVQLLEVKKVENPNYLFLTINISPDAAAGNLTINFKKKNKVFKRENFPLLKRDKNSATRQSYSSKDAVLLIVPDRFANADPSNDNMPGMLEKANRAYEGGRHGGDIQGIIDRLDYIRSLGFTYIWNTPLIENNMPAYSYHGYAATDFYKIDPRFGTNELYKSFVEEAKKRDIGIIWDVVLNHCGAEYYFIKDMPAKDWVNSPELKTRTNHLKSTLLDPYVAEIDRTEYTDGWFDNHMPDLNQRNPLLAAYLIQNTIWWVEYAGLSGFRVDTYSYSDKDFLAKWTKTILDEYPNFNIAAEEWTNDLALSSYWQKGKENIDGFKTYAPTVMDFAFTENVIKTMNAENSWFSSWRELYQSLGRDYYYPNPYNLLIFPDNHDLDRFFTVLNKNFENWKLAMILYMTTRGIPQFYYGTELLFTNELLGNDGFRRADFYGGWAGDTKDAISTKGLTAQEKEAQTYFSKLLNWRKNKALIHSGKLKHYAPQRDDVYVYFRYDDNEKIMVLLNKGDEALKLDMSRYAEMIPKQFEAYDVISEKHFHVDHFFEIPAKKGMILDIK